MILKGVSIIATFAIICVVCAFGSEENCAEEKENKCKLKLLEIFFADFTDQETCQELRGVGECFRNIVDECFGGESNQDIDDALKEFEEFLDNNCQKGGETKCLDDNEEYLMECITERHSDDISQLLQHESVPADMDPKFVRCHLYGLMSHCVVGRAVEKCGAAGGEKAAELLSDLPVSVRESCESMEDSLLETREKREEFPYSSKKKRALPYASIMKRALPYASKKKRDLPYASKKKRDLPYASIMKRDLPYAPIMKRDLPYASIMKRDLPYASIMKRAAPAASIMKRAAPAASTMKRDLPYASIMKRDLPYASIMKRAAPAASTMKRDLPYASIMKRDLPYASIMKRDLPYASIMKRAAPVASKMKRALSYGSK